MARVVRTLFKSFLPGAGQDLSGNAKQGKQEVRGRIVVSSYTRGGELLVASDLGLDKIDYLQLEVVDGVRSPGKAPRFAAWNESNGQFYIFDRADDGTTPDAQVVEIASAEAVSVSFNAYGDSSDAPELK